MDPPYQMDLIIKKTLKKILDFKIIKKETLIILEYAKSKKISIPKDLKVVKKKDYGNSSLKLIKLK
jgi:16S rRNA G966 N2-methylase RsmD